MLDLWVHNRMLININTASELLLHSTKPAAWCNSSAVVRPLQCVLYSWQCFCSFPQEVCDEWHTLQWAGRGFSRVTRKQVVNRRKCTCHGQQDGAGRMWCAFRRQFQHRFHRYPLTAYHRCCNLLTFSFIKAFSIQHCKYNKILILKDFYLLQLSSIFFIAINDFISPQWLETQWMSQTSTWSWSIPQVPHGGRTLPEGPTGRLIYFQIFHLYCTFSLNFLCVFEMFFILHCCRYIVHSDDHNPYLDSMEQFQEKLNSFKPDLLVVGGLQMMDSFPFKQGKWMKTHKGNNSLSLITFTSIIA